MNFSEVFKQTNQLCNVSPDGKYLVSVLECFFGVFKAVKIMLQILIWLHIDKCMRGFYDLSFWLSSSGYLRAIQACGARCEHPADLAALHLLGPDILHGLVF